MFLDKFCLQDLAVSCRFVGWALVWLPVVSFENLQFNAKRLPIQKLPEMGVFGEEWTGLGINILWSERGLFYLIWIGGTQIHQMRMNQCGEFPCFWNEILHRSFQSKCFWCGQFPEQSPVKTCGSGIILSIHIYLLLRRKTQMRKQFQDLCPKGAVETVHKITHSNLLHP